MDERIHLLMSGFFIGSLNDSEYQELKDHLESNSDYRKIFEDYRLLWEQSGNSIVSIPIDTESALIKTKRRIIFRRFNFIQFLQTAAATLILAVLLSITYVHFYRSNSLIAQIDKPVMEQEISTIYGIRSKFQLADGTTVYLNSGSKLIFPVEFKGESRNVKLIGEAFFEVTPNASKPFIVKTVGMNVKVLGTAFDLQAYPESNKI